ncbi:MAG: 3-oxoacid CoA-transferase subunit A [Acholeplasmataceae bacterium]|nr:3-oxoacid CoA-transferase subunit A [Acholeplasmataceae bacterium]
MNKWIDKNEFQKKLFDGQSIMVGGFLTCGTPELLIDYIVEANVKNLTIICNDAGYPDKGVGKLIANNQVKKLIATHIGTNPFVGKLMGEKKLDVELVPQGTFIEQIRAKGGGLGGILTPTGIHTPVEIGKKKITIEGKEFIIAEPISADLALINAYYSDYLGNLTYSGSARNFNPIMATAADVVVALIHEKVESINPEHVITPHVFIDFILGGAI